jgi:hypothetical protein
MKLLYKLFTLMLITSCSTGHVVTTNLHNLANFESNSQIYTLPKTRIVVSFTIDKTEFIPGPYHQYAKKYLGIEDAQALSSNFYEISDIQIKTQSIPDQDYTYSIRAQNFGKVETLLASMKNEGLIMNENIPNYQNLELEKLNEDLEIEYTDLSIKPFFIDKSTASKDNKNLMQQYDKVPNLANQVAVKSLEQKAEEAAKFIFKIRKRRFKLVSGQYEVYPEGVAMEAGIRELDKLEQEYLSLFIGRKKTSTFFRTVIVVPTENDKLQRFTLMRFSDETGVNPADGGTGESIILQLKDMESNETLMQLQNSNISSQNFDVLYYRQADLAMLNILYGSHEVLEAEIPVYQFGVLLPKFIPTTKK